MDNLKPKPGDLVQIWDHTREESKLSLHGKIGYVVGYGKIPSATKKNKPKSPPMDRQIARVIIFGDNKRTGEIVYVNCGWLNIVNKSSDIKKI